MAQRATFPGVALAAALVAAVSPVFTARSVLAGDEAPGQALRRVEQELNADRARRSQLDHQAESLQRELEELRPRLITAAGEARRQEAEYEDLQGTLAGLEREEHRQAERLATDRQHVVVLLAALQRLSMLPPDALLVRPEGPVDIFRTGLLLRDAVPILRERAEALAGAINSLAEVRRRLETHRPRVAAARDSLAAREEEVARLVARREALSRQTEEEREAVAQHMVRLTTQAADLRQLMERIEQERRAGESGRRQGGAGPGAALDAANMLTPPVGGTIAVRYGAADRFGLTSRGVTFAARTGAPVVSPYAGTVVFAGPFRGYGQILIVEHGNGYHSLVAGLGRIDTAVGKSVAAGEPIGSMSSSDDGDPNLYFELRKHGQPINPQRALRAPEGKGQG
jgi:septal ring factor EnvC (AmiA/AmiB activator)